jgi:hypothetical protein
MWAGKKSRLVDPLDAGGFAWRFRPLWPPRNPCGFWAQNRCSNSPPPIHKKAVRNARMATLALLWNRPVPPILVDFGRLDRKRIRFLDDNRRRTPRVPSISGSLTSVRRSVCLRAILPLYAMPGYRPGWRNEHTV